MPYTFALNINDEQGNLTVEDGLPFGDLGSLIKSLDGAIKSTDKQKCTLFAIDNHGYTPHFITKSDKLYENFISVHTNIYEKSIEDLSYNESEYAKTLKKILKEGQYIQAIDANYKTICTIKQKDIEKAIDSYFNIVNKTGIISEIGTKDKSKPNHIYVYGLDYKIYITEQQDSALKNFYKSGKLDFKLRQRVSVETGKIQSAKLLSFKTKNDLSFTESLANIDPTDITFLDNVNTHEDIISLIRS